MPSLARQIWKVIKKIDEVVPAYGRKPKVKKKVYEYTDKFGKKRTYKEERNNAKPR